jgi:hypothetical protein
MYLDFELCDRKQNVLTRLDNRRPGGYVELGLNAARRAFVPLSLEDPALALAKAVETVLRVTLHGPDDFSKVLFVGRVVIPEQTQTEEEEQLGINAIDPFFQLEKTVVRNESSVPGSWGWVSFAADDQSQIMWALVSEWSGGSTHGVVLGTLTPSVSRDRTYVPGKEVGAALIEMTEVINGPDFELEPVVASDGTLCRFNTFFPHQGSDLSDTVRFTIGAAPATASGFVYAPGGEGIVNRVVVIGAPLNSESEEASPIATFPAYVAEDADSIAEYGVWEQVVQLEDVTQVATMQAHAEAMVAAAALPIPYFDFTASTEQVDDEEGEGIPPRFGIDYWIGDTVGADFWAPGAAEPLEVAGRITDATVKELESGAVQVKSSCSPSVKAEGVTGKAITLLIPEVETATEE